MTEPDSHVTYAWNDSLQCYRLPGKAEGPMRTLLNLSGSRPLPYAEP